MECEFPTVNLEHNKIKSLFDEVNSIAIVGLSPNIEKDSNKVALYLQSQGFEIIPIYPKEEYILGEKVYRSLDDVRKKVDMVNIFRKPQVVLDIVNSISRRDDVKVLWTQKGIVNNEAAKKALDFGLKVVQNRCSMVEHKAMKDNVK